jgi:DNA-binding XRE family transcriptional regulator
MPRKPSHRHPLRQVREATKMTQSQFAKLVGSSAPTIQAIENGQRQITLELAEKIMEVTGAWPFCLSENWDEAFDVKGKPYTPLSYLEFTENLDDDTGRARKEISDALIDVLDAAASEGKLRLALHFLSKEIATIVQRLNLDDALCHLFESKSLSFKPRVTVGYLRQNPELAKLVNYVDDPSRKDEEEVGRIIPPDAVRRSHRQSRWQAIDVEAPWFIDLHAGLPLTSDERKVYGAEKIRTEYSIRVGKKYQEEMSAKERQGQ